MRGLIATLILAVAATASAQQVDGPTCYDAVDKLRKAARDAESTASSVNDRGFESSDLRNVHGALEDVESRLQRAKNECGYGTPASRACESLRYIARYQAPATARETCQKLVFGQQIPNFCEICLGRP